MRNFFLKILWASFRIPAKILLFRFCPKIIAITGSAGKTTTKDAIFWILHKNSFIQKKGIRKNPGNLNTELGVPLTILGFKDFPHGGGWIIYALLAFFRAIFTFRYPKILIIEMAADKVGDIKYLTSFVKPHISIVTNVGPAHLEAFGSIDNVAEEKSILIKKLGEEDFAILNFDNDYTKKMGFETQARVTYFGISKDASVYIDNLVEDEGGTRGKIYFGGSSAPLVLRSVGKSFIYAVLAGITVACDIFGLDLIEATQSLEDFEPSKGRSEIISGKKQTLIIDDTYNANPMSMEAAFEIVNILAKDESKKILILGDMLELGKKTNFYHQDIGKAAGKIADYLLVIGKEAQHYIEGAKKVIKNQENLQEFSSPRKAAQFILNKLTKNDIILVKGSRAMKMEQAVEILKK